MLRKTYFTALLIFAIKIKLLAQAYNYDVKHYTLNLRANPSELYIKGYVTTNFKMTRSTDSLFFDLANTLTVDSIIFHQNKINFTHENNKIIAKLPQILQAGEYDSIQIFYQGIPDANGFGSFSISQHAGVPVMWTLSEPFGARDWWPCKQTLNDKADSVDVFITAPKQYKVASNGLRISETIINDSLKITHWKHRYPVATYLIAFAVTNYAEYYEYVNIGDSVNLPVMEMVYPEDSSAFVKESVKIIGLIQLYSDYFGIYPFYKEKYGHAQCNFSGGMEHQTMTFVRTFYYDLIAHELAHQWFGDKVTCGTWHEIWLNEGFAVFCEGLPAEAGIAPYSYKSWKKDTRNNATSISYGSVYVKDTTDESNIFDPELVYQKGGFILHMLRKMLGDSVFFTGVRNYLNDSSLAYGFARVDDLKRHLEEVADTNLTEFFNDWYYGEGYPEYKILWSQDADSLYIEIYQEDASGKGNVFDMLLPFRIVYANNSVQDIKLNNTASYQKFSIKKRAYISKLYFDPNIDILTRNPVLKRLNLTKKIDAIIMPNPAEDSLSVSLKTQTFVKDFYISNLYGQKILSKEMKKQSDFFSIDISNLTKGVYILTISTKLGKIQKTFIKK